MACDPTASGDPLAIQLPWWIYCVQWRGIIAQLISNMASDPTASGDPLAINFLGGIASNGKGIIAQLVLPQLISNMASDPTASGDPLAINFLGGFIASNGEGIIAELSITVWYFQPGLHY
ncbi:hypothetical protein Pst134EB_020147 [Puccinia striiformis f. sp. tritici]|nr:hypothetical protein Pst134EB_020147 [Puccinia striiformis f. sp. tritici]